MTDWQHNPELWEFPCDFPFKIMGVNTDEFVNNVVAEVQKHAPDDYSPVVKPSKNEKYLSVTLQIKLQNKEQLETLYREVKNVPGVKMIL